MNYSPNNGKSFFLENHFKNINKFIYFFKVICWRTITFVIFMCEQFEEVWYMCINIYFDFISEIIPLFSIIKWLINIFECLILEWIIVLINSYKIFIIIIILFNILFLININYPSLIFLIYGKYKIKYDFKTIKLIINDIFY